MDGLANGADTITCPHCGEEMRRGMVRCRQCGKSPSEEAGTGQGDFELTGHELVQAEVHRCALCGAALEPGADDCPSCTSALLDQLLQGPPPDAAASAPQGRTAWPSSAAAELRVRRSPAPVENGRASVPARQAAPDAAQARSRNEAPAKPRAPSTSKGTKSVSQFTAPTQPAPASEKPAAKAPAPAPEPEYSAPTEEDLVAGTTPVETSAACTALLASLSKADVILRCEIATALGKLGDKQALGPLERHMVDPDIRVRRAVAAALVQLGHPKGESLLEIAERKPAKAVLAAAKPAPKPRVSSGSSIDPKTLKIVLGAILGVAVIGGGVWYFMNSSPSTPSKYKKKAGATKKASPAKKKLKGE